MSKRIVILGAGYAGIEAAKNLNKKFRKDPDVYIDLINDRDKHVLLTELHEVAGNRVGKSGVEISLEQLFENTKVKIVKDKIIDFDLENNKISSSSQEYPYDHLILGVGSEPTFYNIPGMEHNSFTLWSEDDAVTLREHIRNMFKLAANENNLEKRKKMLTFVIGGGGFTGIETAGELAEWFDDLCLTYDISRSEVNLIVVEALERILPVLCDEQCKYAEEYLQEELNVEIIDSYAICNVTKDYIEINETNTDKDVRKRIESNTVIWTGGVKGKEILKKTDLELSKDNRIKVDKYLQTTKHENVYAIGDNALFTHERERPLPQLVEAAVQGGECVAENISAKMKNGSMEVFEPNMHGIMVSVGANYGVAELKPFGDFTITLKGFWAMFMKHFINMHYLFGIGGFSLIGDYIEHQFKDTRGGIGMLVRHMMKKSGTYWLAFLRVFVGLRFLIEGINKVNEGWLFGSEEYLVSGASSYLWSSGTPEFYVTLMETFVVPNQVFFQKVLVLTEIVTGLALIGGFLTFLFALVAIGMSANFVIGAIGSTAGIWEPLWILLISITLLSGAGKAFGIDYYLIPWLKNISKKPVKYRNERSA